MNRKDQVIIWKLEEILGVEITDEQAQQIIDARNEILSGHTYLTGVTDDEAGKKIEAVLLAGKAV